jgi:lysyl-tRNA synthetase class II
MSPLGHKFIQSLQIEHILPQTPGNNVIPPEFEDIEAYQTEVSRLGNVTLLESMINQAVNNLNDLTSDWFTAKQVEYVKSNVVMTNMLDPNYQIGKNTGLNRFRDSIPQSFNSWGKESIEKRQNVLMELAFETWKFCDQRLDQQP